MKVSFVLRVKHWYAVSVIGFVVLFVYDFFFNGNWLFFVALIFFGMLNTLSFKYLLRNRNKELSDIDKVSEDR